MEQLLGKLEDIGRATLGIVGVLVLGISSFVVTWAGIELTEVGFQPEALLVAAGVSASIFAVTGLLLFWQAIGGGAERREKRLEKQRQQELLDAAEARGGRVTVAELALQTSYSIDEVGNQLDSFVDDGIAEIGVSDRGREVFIFPEFEQGDDKMTAEDPMRSDVEATFDQFDTGEGAEGAEDEPEVTEEEVEAAWRATSQE